MLLAALLLSLTACDGEWNNPYPADQSGRNILYTAFTDRPKHLDPVQSYTEDEITFTAQIYEPPLQYHYLKRPYTLIPATVEAVPEPHYLDAAGRPLAADAPAEQVAQSVYELRLKPGIRFQPHPAFAVDAAGKPRYEHLDRAALAGINSIADFPHTGTRELTADDYIYEIKRLAHPHLHSPIFGMMSELIVGLKDLGARLQEDAKALPPGGWLDLGRYDLPGAEKVDAHTWRIHIKGKYPQFAYWLAMPFFAPVPREVDRFYSQPGMAEKNLILDWWPVGTGPFMLSENDPNRRMVLSRNPNFRGETYPCEGEAGDRQAGLLADCGKPLPLVDQAVFTREKESIPYWNKFLQGYYDASGIASDNFDQAVRLGGSGEATLTDEMRAQGIRLLAGVRASTFYMGFNLRDPVVGGLTDAGRKLRQAVSIAIDQEEFISIFLNGRGVPAMGPLPPGIFGYEDGKAGINPRVYDWVAEPANPANPANPEGGEARRKSVTEAKRLLAEAGWPNGRNAKTGEPLVLNLDTTSGGMGDKARLDWLTRQFAKIDVQLVIRSTDFNRFQDKVLRGAVQMYFLGWNADYPDPENFFFLLHGKEAKAVSQGENASNYINPEFDRLFERMKNMENTPERLAIIRRMLAILQNDAPWVFSFYPKSYTLSHAWLANRKPMEVGNNTLKYQRIDPVLRERRRAEWNRPVLWPLLAGILLVAALVVPALRQARRRTD